VSSRKRSWPCAEEPTEARLTAACRPPQLSRTCRCAGGQVVAMRSWTGRRSRRRYTPRGAPRNAIARTANRDGSGLSTCCTPPTFQVQVVPGGSQLRSAEPNNDDASPRSHISAASSPSASHSPTSAAERAANVNDAATSQRPGYADALSIPQLYVECPSIRMCRSQCGLRPRAPVFERLRRAVRARKNSPAAPSSQGPVNTGSQLTNPSTSMKTNSNAGTHSHRQARTSASATSINLAPTLVTFAL
jgi:hypothetical protein